MFHLFCVAHGLLFVAVVLRVMEGFPKTPADWGTLLGLVGMFLMAIPLGWQYIQQKVDREMEAE